MSIKATVFNVARCSVNDGPGLRTVIYFKGCNLSCAWCHNPEGLSANREISFAKVKCIGCGRCAEVCSKAHTADGYIRENCTLCGKCVEECTANALEMVGKEYDVESLLKEVKKDEAYFRRGGGVTLSGGECLLQHEFALLFLRACKNEGLNTLVESAFCVPEQIIESVLPYVDTFYVDCKHMDDDIHRKYTGASNRKILENISRFASKSAIVVRVPLIMGVNDGIDNLEKTVLFSKSVGARGVELLRFNPLGVSKYEKLGKKGESFGLETQEKSQIKSLVERLNAFVGEEKFVYSNI